MKTVGKYRVRGLLGKGGMAKVFKIEYPVTGKIGALKLLDRTAPRTQPLKVYRKNARDRYRQRDNWRLPTVDELSTILSPPKTGRDHCIEPAFHTGQEFLWSADRCTHLTAWGVNLELGFVCDGDLSSFYHVKAVCTP